MENIEAGKKLDSLQGGETQYYLPEEGHDTNGEATGRRTEEEPESEKGTGGEGRRHQKMDHIQRDDSGPKDVTGVIKQNKTYSELVCLYLNARSLIGKFDLFTAWALNYSPDVIGVTETWATADILDSELALARYDMFRQDRPVNRAGGGVLLYVKNSLQATLYEPSVSFPEKIWCNISSRSADTILIGVCY